MRWQLTLAEIRNKRLEMARLDPRRGMPVMPPSGAYERDIVGAERRLGFALPPSYRLFLEQHDGFPDLLHGVNLLGVTPLARGTYEGLAREVIDVGGDAAPPRARNRPRLVPFGVDAEGEAMFAWDTSRRDSRGELEVVIWVNDVGARVEDFVSFLDFVDAVLEADVAHHRAECLVRGPAKSVRTAIRAAS